MPRDLPDPVPTSTWLAIDDPDAVCDAYERLWDEAHVGDPPFGASRASAAVEAMAWDPWSHFDGLTWESAWLDAGDREVRVAARAHVEDDGGTPRAVGRRSCSGVRITDRLGRREPPRELHAGRLVLECTLAVRDRDRVLPPWRTRLEAGSVITVVPSDAAEAGRRSAMVPSSVVPGGSR